MREGWDPCPSGQPQLRYWTGSARAAQAPPVSKPGPDLWADLREAGFVDAARRLDEEVATGELTDVDYVRVARVVQRTARQDGPSELAPIAVAIQEKGGGAFLHPSGQH